MIRAASMITLAFLCLSAASEGQTGKLKALMVGNSDYSSNGDKNGPEFESLEPMPTNDVNRMYEALVKNGFEGKEITRKYNLNQTQLATAIEEFSRGLEPNDRALFYFSGHGFSVRGQNYLVPTGFQFGARAENIAGGAISVDSVLNHLLAADTRVIILDACRDEPAIVSHLLMGQSQGNTVRTLISQQPHGTLIAFAAGAGEPADARPVHGMSLYTSVLVSVLNDQPASLERAVDETRSRVFLDSDRLQNPAVYNELQGSFTFEKGPTLPVPAPIHERPDAAASPLTDQDLANIQVRAVIGPLVGYSGGHAMHHVAIYLTASSDLLSRIKEVRYQFPTDLATGRDLYHPNPKVSLDRQSGFRISYVGSGCVDNVSPHVTAANATAGVKALPDFDLCSVWPRE